MKQRFDVPTVLITRHDKTKANTANEATSILKGTKLDYPLTDEGIRQAEKDAKKLGKYDIAAISTSTMKRSKQSAEPLEKESGVKAVAKEGLDPWDIGFLTGWTRENGKDLIEYFIKSPERDVREGESYQSFWNDFTSALAKEMKAAEEESVEGDYRPRVVVTHSCGLLAAEALLSGSKPRPHVGAMPPPGSISALQKSKDGWALDFDFDGTGEPEMESVGAEE